MDRLHNRFSDKLIRVLLQGYCQRQLNRADLQALSGIAKPRFFALLKRQTQDNEGFSLADQSWKPSRRPGGESAQATVQSRPAEPLELGKPPRG